jgi:hypothetical protein
MVGPVKKVLSYIEGNLVAMASEHVPRAANTVAAPFVCANNHIPVSADCDPDGVGLALKKSADLFVGDLFWIWCICFHFFGW